MRRFGIVWIGISLILLAISESSIYSWGQPTPPTNSSARPLENVTAAAPADSDASNLTTSRPGSISADREAYLKIVARVANSCSHIYIDFCAPIPPDSFVIRVFGLIYNTLTEISKIPGSEIGWTLTYTPDNQGLQYQVREDPKNGWTQSAEGDCRGVLRAGDNRTCTFVNSFSPESPPPRPPGYCGEYPGYYPCPNPLPNMEAGPIPPYPPHRDIPGASDCHTQYEFGQPVQYCDGRRIG